jgi:hypothetical protein
MKYVITAPPGGLTIRIERKFGKILRINYPTVPINNKKVLAICKRKLAVY